MRILYIGDNRDRQNWGCRATSAALSALISRKHQIIGRISGRLTLSEEFLYFPASGLNGAVNGAARRNPLIYGTVKKTIRKLPAPIKSRFDFLSPDLEKSIYLIKEYAKINKDYQEIDLDRYRYDAVVINGEGTMIMSSPPRRDTLYYLLFVYWAKKRGKKVFFVNAMFSDCPKTGRNEQIVALTKEILSGCDLVAIRDPLSYRYARECIGLKECVHIPDALFTWNIYDDKGWNGNLNYILPFGCESDKELSYPEIKPYEYVCVSGSSYAAWDQKKAAEVYRKLVRVLKKKLPYEIYLVQACSGDVFLKEVAKTTDTVLIPAEIPIRLGFNILSHAGLYISGRYHPGIMASCGGTPCIFIGANSHKNIGLQEMLAYEGWKEYFAFPPTNRDIAEISGRALSLIGGDIREKIKETVARRAQEACQIIDYIN